jgi:hypothetical protein
MCLLSFIDTAYGSVVAKSMPQIKTNKFSQLNNTEWQLLINQQFIQGCC